MSNRRRFTRGPRRRDIYTIPDHITWETLHSHLDAAVERFGLWSTEFLIIAATAISCLNSPDRTARWGEIEDTMRRVDDTIRGAARDAVAAGDPDTPQAFASRLRQLAWEV